MFQVLRICYLLQIFIGYLTSAIEIAGVNVSCENDNITVNVRVSNWNITNVWVRGCTMNYTIKEFTLHTKCSSVQMKNFTIVTFCVNGKQNTTLAIKCLPSASVYRIADGTEFSRHNMQFEVGGVDMSFKTGITTQSEDISRVYLGDQFYMIMEYLGKSTYTIVPQICTVYKGNIARGTAVEIWNITNGVLDVGLTVMENFNYTSDGRLYAKMYGFRFSGNHGNHDITIRCDLILCLQENAKYVQSRGLKTCKTTRSFSKRKRAISKSLHIIQAYRTDNAAISQKGTITNWIWFIALPWLFLKLL